MGTWRALAASFFFLLLATTSALAPTRSLTGAPKYSSLSRAMRLHQTARSMIRQSKHDSAKRLYETHIYNWEAVPKAYASEEEEICDHICVAQTYLLLALHCQRMGDVEAARAAFREGAERFEADAKSRGCSDCRAHASKLYVSWGLLESKQSNLELAWLLLAKAVRLDRSNVPVLRWKIWDPRCNPEMKWPVRRNLAKEVEDIRKYEEFIKDTAAEVGDMAVQR